MSGNSFSHQMGVFLIFLVISALLWTAMSLNEEVQRDIDCKINITNVPDSVTFITPPPGYVTVNIRARGTQMLRYMFGATPQADIDFRYYNRNNMLTVSRSDLRALVQTAIGDDKTLQAVSPDTIGVFYTTRPPLRLPVSVNTTASTAPTVVLDGPIVSLTDSVSVYAITPLVGKLKTVLTEATNFSHIDRTCVRRVKLVVPAGCRVMPDSVDIRITVEPIVTRSKFVNIRAINVPADYELILEPSRVRVEYRVPRSKDDILPEVEIVADYASISNTPGATRIRIRPTRINPDVFVTADSVDYYLKPINIEPTQDDAQQPAETEQ